MISIICIIPRETMVLLYFPKYVYFTVIDRILKIQQEFFVGRFASKLEYYLNICCLAKRYKLTQLIHNKSSSALSCFPSYRSVKVTSLSVSITQLCRSLTITLMEGSHSTYLWRVTFQEGEISPTELWKKMLH